MRFHFFLFGILFCSMISCTNKLTPGLYRSYSDSGILMAGKTLRVIDDKRFEYQFWSDDIASNRIGHGQYSISGKELILDFEEFPPFENKITSEPVVAQGNFLEYHFSIFDKNQRPLIGVMVELLDTEGHPLKQAVTDMEGKCILVLGKGNLPLKAKTSYLGMMPTELEITDEQATRFNIQLEELTKYVEKGTVYRYTPKIKKGFLILKNEKGRVDMLKRH